MKFNISYDENGKPVYVTKDTGFCISSGPFRPEEDGWMLDQLDPMDFPAIQTGRDMEYLVAEVNSLRRKLFHEKSMHNTYRNAAGFGSV